jgi:hypothetical protein
MLVNINFYYAGLDCFFIIKYNVMSKKMFFIGSTRRNKLLFDHENLLFILNFTLHSVQTGMHAYSYKIVCILIVNIF